MCKASSTILTYAIDACAAQLAYVGVSNTTIGGPDVTLSSSATEALVMALFERRKIWCVLDAAWSGGRNLEWHSQRQIVGRRRHRMEGERRAAGGGSCLPARRCKLQDRPPLEHRGSGWEVRSIGIRHRLGSIVSRMGRTQLSYDPLLSRHVVNVLEDLP
jgi:hypothetical protein